MHTKSIAEIITGLASREFSSIEITQHFLQRIKTLDKHLNSFVTVTEEQALKAAEHADNLRAKGQASLFTGVPFAHKDIFCTKGVRTSCASKMLDNFIAPYESTVTQKFLDAGAVMLGKTNMDEFAMGSSNESSFYGPTKNPWDTTRVPGGSSGGSAAAVAAGLIPGATGTDTGGSIRQPAAFCGITGIKPTYGRVSRWGMIAFASSLDQAGPMAKSAEDCAYMLNIMAGFDKKDSTSVDTSVADYTAALSQSLKGLKIGIPKEYLRDDLDPQMLQAFEEVVKTYEKLGATVQQISLPHTELAVPAYYVIAPAECSSNLSRMDGVRFGHRCESPIDLEDLYKRSRAEGFGSEVKRRILIGTYALSAGYYDAYYLQAQKVRRLIKDDFVAAYQDVDVILSPTCPTPAFKLGEKTDDPVTMYLEDIFTIATNLAGLPALSMPAGSINNLPVGVQLIGNYFAEAQLLNAAHQYQQVTDWHQQNPSDETILNGQG